MRAVHQQRTMASTSSAIHRRRTGQGHATAFAKIRGLDTSWAVHRIKVTNIRGLDTSWAVRLLISEI
jgi:hypothetical protein